MRVLCIIFLPLEQPHKIGAVMPSGRRVFEDDRMIFGGYKWGDGKAGNKHHD
jgi:hypothetical protein